MHRGECGVDQSFVWACEKLGIKSEMPPMDWQGGLTSPKRHDQLIAGSDLCVLLHLDFVTSEDTKREAAALRDFGRSFTELYTSGRSALSHLRYASAGRNLLAFLSIAVRASTGI